MKKLAGITLLTSFLVALGMPSFAAHDSSETPPPKTIVKSPLPAEDPFDEETSTDAPIQPSPLPLLLAAPPVVSMHRTPGTVHRVAKNLATELGLDLDLAPPIPIALSPQISTQNPSGELVASRERASLTKSPSVKSTDSIPANTAVPVPEALRTVTAPSRPRSSLFACFSCINPPRKSRSPSLMAQDSNLSPEVALGIVTTGLMDGGEEDLPLKNKEGYDSVFSDPEAGEVPGGDLQSAAPLSGTASWAMGEEEVVSSKGPAEPELSLAQEDDLVPQSSGGALPLELVDKPVFTGPTRLTSAQIPPADSGKKKTSWWRSCWPKTKQIADVVKEDLKEAFVDIAPYLEDGLKLVAASSPNPAIQGVINSLAILIKEASSAVTQDGATFYLTTKNHQRTRFSTPPLLLAHHFSNEGNLSEESKMVISIILDRTAPALNYGHLIGFINMVIAQDNNSPETIRFDSSSGNISLFPNNMVTQPVLVSLPILDSLRNPDDRESTSQILLEYVAATEDRASVEKILGRQLGSNFLPTPESWVRTAFQDLVGRDSPFVLDHALSIEEGIDSATREEAVEKETQLATSLQKLTVRVPLAKRV